MTFIYKVNTAHHLMGSVLAGLAVNMIKHTTDLNVMLGQ
jgi:hypothetical protein